MNPPGGAGHPTWDDPYESSQVGTWLGAAGLVRRVMDGPGLVGHGTADMASVGTGRSVTAGQSPAATAGYGAAGYGSVRSGLLRRAAASYGAAGQRSGPGACTSTPGARSTATQQERGYSDDG